MIGVFRKMAGLSRERVQAPIKDAKPDQQSADVANAAQRVNQRTDQVRATLAELLKATDGKSQSMQGLQ
jgi:hypothetical protein